MAQINIKLTPKSDEILNKVKTLGAINGLKLNNKESQTNQALLWFNELITLLDDETLLQIINLKKSF